MSEDGIEAPGPETVPRRVALPWSAGADVMCDAQKAIAAEAMSSVTEMLDRLRTEVHLWNEFVSKVAVAHSVKDYGAVWQECGRHQIEFARRQADLMFDHGQRALDAAARRLGTPTSPE